MINSAGIPSFNSDVEGEDTPDSCQTTSQRYTYAESPKYFQNTQTCVEDGIMHKPFIQSWMGGNANLCLVIEPHEYQPIEKVYSDGKVRKSTFKNWPLYMQPTSQELVDAGFYYLGESDRVRCFCCGVTLRNWKLTDKPRLEHERHAPHCLFIHIFSE